MSGIILGIHAIEELLRSRQVEGTLMLVRKGSKTEKAVTEGLFFYLQRLFLH
jgi:hypothetical protein